MEKKRIFRESEENASNSIHQSRQRKCRKRISLNKKKECNAKNEEQKRFLLKIVSAHEKWILTISQLKKGN